MPKKETVKETVQEVPAPVEETPVSVPEVVSVTEQPVVSIPESSTVIAVEPKQVDVPVVADSNAATIATIAVVATAAVATGVSVLVKGGHLKKLKSKSNSNNSKQDQQRNKQEEKKKEEQTKCDAKSKEVQSLIDETNDILLDMEKNFYSFLGIDQDKELNKKFEETRKELKKLKKTIKDLE